MQNLVHAYHQCLWKTLKYLQILQHDLHTYILKSGENNHWLNQNLSENWIAEYKNEKSSSAASDDKAVFLTTFLLQ